MSHPATVYPESGLIFTPPKISHTGRHCVGCHAVVCYGVPEWFRVPAPATVSASSHMGFSDHRGVLKATI
jgi:hypothetical protein